jgi:hypothetical protein
MFMAPIMRPSSVTSSTAETSVALCGIMTEQSIQVGSFRAGRKMEASGVSRSLYVQGTLRPLNSVACNIGAMECATGYPKRNVWRGSETSS